MFYLVIQDKKKKEEELGTIWATYKNIGASLVAQTLKNLPEMQETQVQSLVGEDPLEKKRAPTPVFLPGKSHRQRSLRVIVHRVAKSLT